MSSCRRGTACTLEIKYSLERSRELQIPATVSEEGPPRETAGSRARAGRGECCSPHLQLSSMPPHPTPHGQWGQVLAPCGRPTPSTH